MNIELQKLSGDPARFFGAVYTPIDVADAIVAAVAPCLPDRSCRVLEPSVGDGVFLDGLMRSNQVAHVTAIDIDKAVIENLHLRHLDRASRIDLKADNFLEFALEHKRDGGRSFDLVIGNPPFIRKHNFSTEFKGSLEEIEHGYGFTRDLLKNSWSAFVLTSEQLLSADGVMTFVLPYEILTVSYGQAVLERLANSFERLDLFVSDRKAFPKLDQDAVIVICRKRTAAQNGTFVQRVEDFEDLSTSKEHKLQTDGECIGLKVNSFLIGAGLRSRLQNADARLPSIGKIASSAPGIVTAANDYFILDDEKVAERGLADVVQPILRKSSQIPRSPILTQGTVDRLRQTDATNLLVLTGEEASFSESVREYLADGVRASINQRYKCRNRRNWYEVRLVPPAPLLFFKRAHALPRMCLNDAEVYVTDSAYGIMPKPGYSPRGIFFSFYNSLTALFAEIKGRFYGGGVLELTPTELRSLPILYQEPTDAQFSEFCDVYRKSNGDPLQILDFGDANLSAHTEFLELGLEVSELRTAWLALKSHRLRHSRSR